MSRSSCSRATAPLTALLAVSMLLAPARRPFAARPASDRGQGTAEYALVLIAVTAMVAVVIAYVSGDGGGLITGLFSSVFARMRGLVGG